MSHTFTTRIKDVLHTHFADHAEAIFKQSHLIGYLNYKTKSADRNSKARGSFANLYAIYVLVEDYIAHDFHVKGDYVAYEGAEFNKLMERQRELPFGARLQNHGLNNRVNGEFKNLYPTLEAVPITNKSRRYWLNDQLLKISINGAQFNIALCVIAIIDEYVKVKRESFEGFMEACEDLQKISPEENSKVEEFIASKLEPYVDARIFEIISYAILKYSYSHQTIYWGSESKPEAWKEERLVLYKTGRTNANDGGIDFVLRPLGRFFQVTETLDFKKYFLDIDKIQRYPITFVIKSKESNEKLLQEIEKNALKKYKAQDVVKTYMACIEEVINIPTLNSRFKEAVKLGSLNGILGEIITQSKVEFNYGDSEDDDLSNPDRKVPGSLDLFNSH